MSKPLIFLVDDSETMLLSLKTGLELEGFSVETAQDGVIALAKLNAGSNPDLIITDMSMPNMNGIEFIKRVREISRFRFKPILAFTTTTQQHLRDESKKAGATGWLVKPVPNKEMVAIINQILQKKN